MALAHQGRTTEAISHYTEALRLQPENAEAHNNLGNVLYGSPPPPTQFCRSL
jgi:Flp pilus assembly protein TadD